MNTRTHLAAWLWFIVLAMAVLTLVSLTRYMYRVQRLERVYQVVATQNAILLATRDALSARLTATPDPQELERYVRERLGQVQPGEVPVRVMPEETRVPFPSTGGRTYLRDVPPWFAWWLLFFGSELPTRPSP